MKLFSILAPSLYVAMLFWSKTAISSPIPGVGSSHVSQLLKNIIVSEYGFKIGTTDQSFWSLKADATANIKNSFSFVANNSQSNARFTINIDKFTNPMSFDSYVRKWVKEYPYFGFEILKTQVMKLGGQPCYLVDFAHRGKNKQMRQFVVVKKDFAVVMTCADEIQKFKDTALQCAELINNFQWTTASTQ